MEETNCEAARTQEEFNGYEYNALMAAMHVSVSKHLMDEDFTVIWCNDFYLERIGYTREEYAERFRNSVRKYYGNDQEEYAKISAHVRAALIAGESRFECVARMPRRDGSYIWIKIVGLFTEEKLDGVPVIYTVFTDITDVVEQQELQKRLEERSELLRTALERAEKASEAKSDFLSRMSHDIRTPMNAVMGMLTLARTHLSEPVYASACLEKAETSARFLLSLLNDILDMSKIESGKMALRKEGFDFPKFVHRIKTMFQGQAEEKGVSFQVTVEEGLETEYVGDELRLGQVVMNLVSNAVKFTPAGGSVSLVARKGKRAGKSAELVFTVRDTGIGMDAAQQGRLFRPFEQDVRQRESAGGSGLGLAIAQSIARMMNGEITVDSAPGRGSAFTARLWVDFAEKKKRGSVIRNRFRDQRVLIFGEDTEEREYMARLLGKFGLQTREVSSHRATLQILEDETREGTPFDLVIIDWQTADAGFLRLVRAQCAGRTQLMAVSSGDTAALEGVDYVLPRPVFASSVYNLLLHLTKDVAAEDDMGGEIQFSGQRLLLVEDNEMNLEIAQALLQSHGLCVDIARDGREALTRFEQSAPGRYFAILMDIQMPVMDGFAATRAIRALSREDAGKIPIIALSANAFDEDVEKSLEAGMDAHVSKPMDMRLLCEVLAGFLPKAE